MNRLENGTVIKDRYRIDSLLARGGMSRIYLGTPLRGGPTVVIKQAVFASGVAPSELELAQFYAEYEMLSPLTHPALPTVLARLEESGSHFIVEEYFPGKPLRTLLDEGGAMPVEQAIPLLRELLDALIYLHRRNIVHRDIKAENLLVTDQGRLRVLDFGAARLFSPLVSEDEYRIGTLGYASPEHYQGQTDARSDLYSTGVLMHFMLSGIVPEACEDYRPAPYADSAPVPDYLKRVCFKALEPDPRLRYQSARSMRAALHPPRSSRSAYSDSKGSWSLWFRNLKGVHAAAREVGELERRPSRFAGQPRLLACTEPLMMPGAEKARTAFLTSVLGAVVQAWLPDMGGVLLGGGILTLGTLATLVLYLQLRRRWQPFEFFYVELYEEGLALLREPGALQREEFAWDEIVSYRLIAPPDSLHPYTAEIVSRSAQALLPDGWPLLGELTDIVLNECYLQNNLARFDKKVGRGRVVQAWEEVR